MMRDQIREKILSLDLGYKYLMSDYATSSAQERTMEEIGLADVERVVDELEALFETRVEDDDWENSPWYLMHN